MEKSPEIIRTPQLEKNSDMKAVTEKARALIQRAELDANTLQPQDRDERLEQHLSKEVDSEKLEQAILHYWNERYTAWMKRFIVDRVFVKPNQDAEVWKNMKDRGWEIKFETTADSSVGKKKLATFRMTATRFVERDGMRREDLVVHAELKTGADYNEFIRIPLGGASDEYIEIMDMRQFASRMEEEAFGTDKIAEFFEVLFED